MAVSTGAITHCKQPIFLHIYIYGKFFIYTLYHFLVDIPFYCRYIRPQFFYNNPLLSFIQYVVGPYTDDLGNVLPYAVEGVGVPVDPLAFAGLLGKFLE